MWLSKNDSQKKEYDSNRWYNILIAKIHGSDTFYCMSNRRILVSDSLQNKLLSALCVSDSNYSDCLVILPGEQDYGFIWQHQKCFSLSKHLIDDLSPSSMSFFKEKQVIRIHSEEEVIKRSKVTVKKVIPLLPVLFVLIFLIIAVGVGFLWLL